MNADRTEQYDPITPPKKHGCHDQRCGPESSQFYADQADDEGSNQYVEKRQYDAATEEVAPQASASAFQACSFHHLHEDASTLRCSLVGASCWSALRLAIPRISHSDAQSSSPGTDICSFSRAFTSGCVLAANEVDERAQRRRHQAAA